MSPLDTAFRDDGEPLSLAIAAGLEAAATAIARLDSALGQHPLAPAWLYRARLDAVARQAAVDGKAVDPWGLAALIEGVRLRLDRAPSLLERGAILAAARHALDLYQWFANPRAAQRGEIEKAADHLVAIADRHPPLLGAGYAVHDWLDDGGERPPLRAALAVYWVHRGVTTLPSPLLTGAAAFAAGIPRERDRWIAAFLEALAAEAGDGLVLLRRIERQWYAARAAVAGRRRDSHAAAAIDLLAAAPLLSATSLARLLGIAIKNATRLLDGFVARGIVIEVTRRSKRRLYGLQHLTPLREASAAPRRPQPGRRPGRPGAETIAAEIKAAEPVPALLPSPPLPALMRQEFDFSDIDRLLHLTDDAIRRAKAVLGEYTYPGDVQPGRADDIHGAIGRDS